MIGSFGVEVAWNESDEDGQERDMGHDDDVWMMTMLVSAPIPIQLFGLEGGGGGINSDAILEWMNE